MLGIVFTEFMEMVESKFGYDMVDKLIEQSTSDSNGVYTSVGTYPHTEIVEHVVNLHKESGLEIPLLLNTFGKYLHGTFVKNYSGFFDSATNAFDFLESIENYIHVEVRKLYPDAELPSFESERVSETQMILYYQSVRRMGPFAQGLIEQTMVHYKEPADVTLENIEADGSRVKFTINKK